MAPTSGYTDFLGLYIVILDRFPVDLDKFEEIAGSTPHPAILPQYGTRNCWRIRQIVSDSTNLVSILQCPGTVERARQIVSGSSDVDPNHQCGVTSHSTFRGAGTVVTDLQ